MLSLLRVPRHRRKIRGNSVIQWPWSLSRPLLRVLYSESLAGENLYSLHQIRYQALQLNLSVLTRIHSAPRLTRILPNSRSTPPPTPPPPVLRECRGHHPGGWHSQTSASRAIHARGVAHGLWPAMASPLGPLPSPPLPSPLDPLAHRSAFFPGPAARGKV
jgi:hypothetical protein